MAGRSDLRLELTHFVATIVNRKIVLFCHNANNNLHCIRGNMSSRKYFPPSRRSCVGNANDSLPSQVPYTKVFIRVSSRDSGSNVPPVNRFVEQNLRKSRALKGLQHAFRSPGSGFGDSSGNEFSASKECTMRNARTPAIWPEVCPIRGGSYTKMIRLPFMRLMAATLLLNVALSARAQQPWQHSQNPTARGTSRRATQAAALRNPRPRIPLTWLRRV